MLYDNTSRLLACLCGTSLVETSFHDVGKLLVDVACEVVALIVLVRWVVLSLYLLSILIFASLNRCRQDVHPTCPQACISYFRTKLRCFKPRVRCCKCWCRMWPTTTTTTMATTSTTITYPQECHNCWNPKLN